MQNIYINNNALYNFIKLNIKIMLKKNAKKLICILNLLEFLIEIAKFNINNIKCIY